MKTKIYLSKSNRANPDDVSRIRSIIQQYQKDIELVEFKGGSYSHKDLLSCDMLLIIPDLTDFNSDYDDTIPIGKGIHEQIEAFRRVNKNKSDIIVVNTVTENWNACAPLYDLDILDTDDYVNYSAIVLNTDPDTGRVDDLDDIIKTRFVSGDSEGSQTIKSNKYMYLLVS
jgi:hypothetical protein